MISSRSLEMLHPEVREKCEQFLWWVKVLHRFGAMKNVFITCTYRDREKQAELYARGRDETGKVIARAHIVTWARPGESMHNHEDETDLPASLAFDVAFRPWGDPRGATWKGNWTLVGRIAKHCGLEWGGYWPSPKTDKPHLQYVLEDVHVEKGVDV